MTNIRIAEALTGDKWTASEKWVIKWQFRLLGDFQTALANTIMRADEENLVNLSIVFPDQVAGFIAWNRGDLGERLHAAGIPL